MKYVHYVYILALLLSCNIQILSMEQPQPSESTPIATVGDVEIYLKLFNNDSKNLTIDTLSPFDVSPASFTRKQWGLVTKNNQLQIVGEKTTFDKLDKRLVAALHIHTQYNNNDGIVAKIFYDSEKKEIETHLYSINGISQTLMKKETYSLKKNQHSIFMVTLNFTVDSNNWKNTILSFEVTPRAIPLPQIPHGKGNEKSKWKFWKK